MNNCILPNVFDIFKLSLKIEGIIIINAPRAKRIKAKIISMEDLDYDE
jgi:hypothetical protein